MDADPPSILFIAGDVSGDVHSAALARKLLQRDPTRALHALGGCRLREAVNASAGGEFLGDTTNCSAIGITTAVRFYFRCRKLRERLREFLSRRHVDVVVLCDWGGFNGRILPELHARGLRVLYYFPPGSWRRSGTGGLRIVPFVSRVATPFDWSAERLQNAGCRAEWVGHPALEKVRSAAERAEFRQRFGVRPDDKLVALLPGSRETELRLLAPRMAKAAAMLQRNVPNVRAFAVVPEELAGDARAHLPKEITVLTNCANELLGAADAAVVKTGTASLEAAVAGTPHVAVYDVSYVRSIEWYLLWAWKRIPFIAMPNIILQRGAVPELIGNRCNPENIARELTRLLTDAAARDQMQRDYEEVHRALGRDLPFTATARTAEIVEEMLAETAPHRREPAAAAAL
jgi:lipid-A-disaccharide synthase